MPKRDAAAELAARVVETLTHLRGQGGGAYPPTLPELAARLDPPPAPELLGKALTKKPFAANLLRARKKDADSLVALAEDANRLAADPRLVAAALAGLCTAEKPLFPLPKVVGQVEKPLRPVFEAELRRCAGADDWPAGVGCILVKGRPHLFLSRFPPPPALAARAAVESLAAKLLRGLETSPRDGVLTLRQLADAVAPAATADDLRAASAEKTFKARVVLALPNNLASPLAAADQVERLAADALVLELALAATRTADNQAVKVADLKKKLDRKIQPAFDRVVAAAVAAGTLPPAVGCLRIRKTPHLFLTRDVGKQMPGRDREAAVPAAAPAELGGLIVAAFDRLDREKGGHNFVNLLALRRAVSADRAAFDAEVQRLRRSGRFTLSAAEGRHGLSAEEREAGVVEEGVLMLYLSRLNEGGGETARGTAAQTRPRGVPGVGALGRLPAAECVRRSGRGRRAEGGARPGDGGVPGARARGLRRVRLARRRGARRRARPPHLPGVLRKHPGAGAAAAAELVGGLGLVGGPRVVTPPALTASS
jgi:hypothetical protein